ncbi:MAG: hypothetical protein U1B83_07010, partial [Candidatus Cloacimonadaceae bacterium]|nr:hypothetical protein [Candidatus Cloacimonadaceae bacterium]
RIMAIEWAIALADKDRALLLLDHPWEDELALEYAALMRLLLTQDSFERVRLAREFLTQNPNSIFSPNFRQRLSDRVYSKPKL